MQPTSTCFYRGKRKALYQDTSFYDFDSGDEVLDLTHGSVTLKSLLTSRKALLHLVDKDGYTAMDYATAINNMSAVKYLSRKGFRQCAISHATAYFSQQTITSLDKMKASAVDANGWTPLHDVAFQGGNLREKMRKVEKLVSSDTDINATTKRGRTALHLAALADFSNTPLMKYLVANGAQLDLTDEEGNTALMLAAGRNRCDAVEMLAKKGASLYNVDRRGYNALHLAAQAGHAAVVRILVRLDSDLRKLKHQKTRQGRTPSSLSGLAKDLFISLWELAEAGEVEKLQKQLGWANIDVASLQSFQTGFTLLHSAVLGWGRKRVDESALEGVLNYLLSQWPEMANMCDRYGRTPLELAVKTRAPAWVHEALQRVIDETYDSDSSVEGKRYDSSSEEEDEVDELQEIADRRHRRQSLSFNSRRG